ncbi:MAG: DnaJ domain-containing protein [Desulfobacterales bacterium]|jgi:DnaJ like chaperone protein|nr:DnaJ domain-containing protein [Desulfobacterales bacterium]
MWKTVLLILLAVLYGASPYDIFPDFIPGWGWLDDIAVIWFLWHLYKRIQQRLMESGSADQHDGKGARQNDAGRAHESKDQTNGKQFKKSPHTILGVLPNASGEEIKQAYRRLANQYHPDKVSHLGDEFKLLAEKRFKEIQEAYQSLMKP